MECFCYFCGTRVDTNSNLTASQVYGWVFPRQQGGANALALREPTGHFACWSCIDRQRKGLPANQTSLV